MYYIIAFIVSFVCWILFVSLETKKMNINLAVIFTIATVSNGGYLAMALAKNVQSALLAQKIIYLVVLYAPVFLLFNIAALCKINIPKRWRFLLVVLVSSIYVMVLSAGHTDLYYKSIKMHKYNGISYITKEYGPGHMLYNVLTYSIVIASIIMVVYAICHRKVCSIKNSVSLLAILVLMVIVFFSKKLFGTYIQTMPMFYSVLVIALYVLYMLLLVHLYF